MTIVDPSFLTRWEQYLHIEKVDAQKSWGNSEFSFITDLLKEHVFPFRDNSKSQILDVGCGDGYLIYLLRELGHDAFGTTYKEEERINAGQHDSATAGAIFVCDMHNLPCVDNIFDICISRQSLEHALAPVVVMWEMHRVLKKNGYLLLHVPNNTAGEEDGTNPTHHYAFTPKQWVNLVRLNGFDPQVHGEDTKYGGYFIIAKRKDGIPLIGN